MLESTLFFGRCVRRQGGSNGCSGSRTALNAFWKRKGKNAQRDDNDEVQQQGQVSQSAASTEEGQEASASPNGLP